MAGAGYKLFNTGDVLTAAQVNTYLQEQTVMVFASAAARTTALTSVLAEGMVSYLQDTNAVEVYNGSAWVGVSGAGDVTEVQAGTGISVANGTGPIPIVTSTVATTFDAKGDLVVGTGADTFAKLTVGTNDYVLTAASGETTGLKWAAPASGTTFAGARVKKTASQTISNNTTTTITWNDEDFDTNTYHDNSTDNSRFTIPSGKAGYYHIIANICTAGSNTGARVVEIFKNTTRIDRVDREPVTNQNNILTSTIFDFAVGDYIEAKIYQDSGTTISVVTDSRFSIAYLGA